MNKSTLGASIAGKEESKETLKPPRCNLSARVDTTAVGVGLITRGAKEGDTLAYAERRGRDGAPVWKSIWPVESRIDPMQLQFQLPRYVVGEVTVLLPRLNGNIAKYEPGTAQDAQERHQHNPAHEYPLQVEGPAIRFFVLWRFRQHFKRPALANM